MTLKMNAPLDALKGVGGRTKELFSALGVNTIGDLLDDYPRAYDEYGPPLKISSLQEGALSSVCASLAAPVSNRYLRGRCISTASCVDETGELLLTWYNMPYIKNSVRAGIPYVFRGRIRGKGGRLIMDHPSVFRRDQYQDLQSTLQPVYALTRGIHTGTILRAVRQVLDDMDGEEEYLPEEMRDRYDLIGFREAMEGIHFPKDSSELQRARRRLIFDEFFFFILQLRSSKGQQERAKNSFPIRMRRTADAVISSLPYELTGAQKRVWSEISRDLVSDHVMSRLIQGDVGSGKTILAVLALLTVAENGYQGALMAPTEVLARQHYDSLREILRDMQLPFHVELLVGSQSAAQKREVYAKMAAGECDIVVGTHALIQDKALYHHLALVITDEQHRFGVRQRERLFEKGNMPHTIVMSATPIPRTLAGILYGDLDISILDEQPSDRLPVKNCVVSGKYRQAAYRFIEDQVRSGHQAYVICPMVEQSDRTDAENVLAYTEILRGQFPPEICVETLHGRMKADQKNEIMERFLKNEIQVLVSTTVVEVGVNVPNATVMMIENAERFGLSELHQLRGRVGRGDAQSYCIFMCLSEDPKSRERLEILRQTNDGFEIAARDLQQRGPGDLFGVRQSGMMNFRLADIYADADLLQLADEAVRELTRDDPSLTQPAHQGIRQKYERLLAGDSDHLSL